MKPLFPDVAERLRAAADEREHPAPHELPSRPRRSSRRPGWRTGLVALAGGLLISTGAYAARGLWQPELGTENGRPTAIAGPPSMSLVDRFAVLRRPQTEADRGAASQQALKFTGSADDGVRTDFVRRLEPAGTDDAVVLVPITMGDGSERLCVWVGPREAREGVGGSRGCGTAREALQGSMWIGIGEMPDRDDPDEAELASLRRQQSAILGPDRGSADRDGLSADDKAALADLDEKLREASGRALADHTLRVVGLVPDGVTQVRLGNPARIVPIHDNVYSLVILERELGNPMRAELLDGDGKTIPWQALGVPNPALTGPPGEITPAMQEKLTVALSTNVDPAFSDDFARFTGRIFDACRQLRHDPPLTEAHQVHHVQRQFQKDIDGFDDRDASLLLEVLRGTYCPIAG
ncbi:MAG: hypothetical protein Q7T55_05730 [Solirubrobacteraceae bacterium]|nr:hypothetical protein [Solirubrobacteraceae bacterium]